jgi:hypothetical protein
MIIPAKNATISIQNPDGSWSALSDDPVESILSTIDRLNIPLLPPVDVPIEHTISILDSNWRSATKEDIQRIIEYRLSILSNRLEV